MSATPDTVLDRIRRIRAAAQEAQEAETMAEAAQSFDAQEAFWQRFDEANATILGLILSDDGKYHLDALEHALGGRS